MRWIVWPALPLLALAACNNLSKVGNLPQGTAKAVAGVVGQPYTTDSSGMIHTTVRAGADVVLTGVNSESVPDDTGVPIIQWQWSQANPGSTPVDLIKRTSQAWSFTAPQVTQPTTLTFQLTVTNANGESANTQAQVDVEPVRDADHFLTYLNTRDAFTVTAVTSAVVSGSAQAAATDTIGFTISVQKLVTYTDLNGTQHSRVPAGPVAKYSGGWSAQLGSGGSNCADARNPQMVIPIPKLNLDDPLGDGSGNRLSDVMETSDVDRDPASAQIPPALVEAQIQIAPASALSGGTTAEICVGDPSKATPAASATVAADALTVMSNSSTALFDTSASAHSYYQTIDPNGTRTTLSDWLKVNAFNPDVSGWGADAHAIYTNNYDLGFGRDMYLKVGSCDAGYSAAPLSQFGSQSLPAATAQALSKLVGHCDVAAVVVNYVGVQAAAEHLNSIVAVAMEYSAAPGTGARFVKFYVFAPDTRTGALQRITSVDLDHRGQKAVPQSCVVCHGGTPAPGGVAAASYPSTAPSNINGDVNAGFIPWDLDSFFYSDTDPGFSQKAADASLKGQYTRSNQETQLKLLNVGAYLTMTDPNRFALERELLEGWYAGAGLPNAFTGSFVPPGWNAGGSSNNPSDSASLYTNAFARDCRMCHVLQAPPAGVDPRTASGADANNAPVPSACSQAAVTSNAATAYQVPMGCYWEFANSRNLQVRLSNGQMPFARRTSDRFWVQPDGSTSAGALMQKHFAAQTPPVTIATPGTSIAVFNTPPGAYNAQADGTAASPIDIGSAIRLDATNSAFPDTVSWNVSACTGTPASPGQCARSLPVAGAGGVLAWFIADDAATYRLSLVLDNGQGAATATPYYYQIGLLVPQFVTPTPTLSLQLGSNIAVAPSALISQYGNGGAANNSLLIQAGAGIAVTPAACTSAPGCTVGSIPNGFTLQSTGNTAGSSSIMVTVKGLGSSSQAQTETVPVTLTAAVQAPTPIYLQSVQANSGQASFNLLNAVTQNNSFPNCVSVKVASVQYSGGRQSLSSFDVPSQTLSYTPQAGFATYSNGGTPQSVQQETFSYVLACTLQNNTVENTTNPAQFVIPVQARQSFASVQAVWNNSANCSTNCHNSANAPTLGNLGSNSQTYTELTTGYTDDMLNGKTWNSNHILFVNLSSLSNSPPDLSSVGSSGLLCWPSDNCTLTTATAPTSHSGGSLGGDAEITTIRQWIEDGANNF